MARDYPYLELAQDAVQHAMKELSRSRTSRTYKPDKHQEKEKKQGSRAPAPK
jgi:hypothetical protein